MKKGECVVSFQAQVLLVIVMRALLLYLFIQYSNCMVIYFSDLVASLFYSVRVYVRMYVCVSMYSVMYIVILFQ